ncbi:MAG TPA: TetR/AcrR family transcriptional regulator [Nitrospirae bacterium]|nr:TetR/AcrR family transcriptional regulator [Nitrospirota bacterium]
MNRKTPASSAATKLKILDAAEALFAHNGYRGTSLRAITGKAGVNLAAVNYHFGSKVKLLEEVIKRRILPLNKIRMNRLEEVRDTAKEKGIKPDIKDVLLAFIEPTIMFVESGQGAKSFVTFIGRSIADPDDTVKKVFLRFIMPIFQLLLQTTCDALPDKPRDTIFWRLHFMMGALFHTMHVWGNTNIGPKDINFDIDAESLIDQIIPYVTAGMKAR